MNSRFRASVREGNRFVFLGEGHDFFSRMLAAIDGSQRYILAEFYLVESGQVIYEYQPRFLHTKLVLCDDWVSMLWNLDANQEIDSAAFATQAETLFTQTFDASVTLRRASDVVHHWSVPFWRLIARAILAWSARAEARLRR